MMLLTSKYMRIWDFIILRAVFPNGFVGALAPQVKLKDRTFLAEANVNVGLYKLMIFELVWQTKTCWKVYRKFC